jgi:peptide/nickel transport system permease protein
MVGVLVGTLAGFAGGVVDRLCMRLVDVVLTVPPLILALAITGLFEPSLLAVMLGLISILWAGYARIVRGLVLAVKERPFVEAARAAGAGPGRVAARHIVPNMMSPVVVLATVEIGQLLLAVSTLTFLGLGAPPPTPEWGAMLNEGRTYFLSDPHVVLIPGIAISLAVLGFNLVGDGVRDALDPRLVGERPLSAFRLGLRHHAHRAARARHPAPGAARARRPRAG